MTTDANNGPKPLDIAIKFVGELGSWLVTLVIEVAVGACPQQAYSPIVSSRYNDDVPAVVEG